MDRLLLKAMPQLSPQALAKSDGRAARQGVEDNAFHLWLYRSAYEVTAVQGKSPREMRRAADAYAFVRDNVESGARVGDEAVPRIGAEIHLMMSAGNAKCLCQFAGTGAKLTEIVNATAPLHQFNPSPWLERANQNKTVRRAFD